MSYREVIAEEIEKLQGNISSRKKQYEMIIRRQYDKALEEAKATGHSIESITYELLEGVERGMRVNPDAVEEALALASEVMVDLLHHSAVEDIARKQKQLMFAKAALEETVEREKSHLQDSLETFRVYAQEHGHHRFVRHMSHMEKMIGVYMGKLAGEIKYNHSS